MMAIKFVMVVLFFMHLRVRLPIFGRLFWTGLILGRRVYIAALGTFNFFVVVEPGGRCRVLAVRTNAWAFQPHPEVWLLVGGLIGGVRLLRAPDRSPGRAPPGSRW